MDILLPSNRDRQEYITYMVKGMFMCGLRFWHFVTAINSIGLLNLVAVRWANLWVGKSSFYLTSQLGCLSLQFSVGLEMNTAQSMMMFLGSEGGCGSSLHLWIESVGWVIPH